MREPSAIPRPTKPRRWPRPSKMLTVSSLRCSPSKQLPERQTAYRIGVEISGLSGKIDSFEIQKGDVEIGEALFRRSPSAIGSFDLPSPMPTACRISTFPRLPSRISRLLSQCQARKAHGESHASLQRAKESSHGQKQNRRFDQGDERRAKEAVGKAIGDAKLQSDGRADQAVGKIQNAVGGLSDAVSDAVKKP